MPNRRFITCQSDSSVALRTETLEGRQHLIVPIIGLIGDTIIHPANAPSPEYVPLSVLEEAPEIWNNRIVVPLHPMRGDHYVSANDPEMTDKYKFGVLFNSRIEDAKLKFDAWLDIDRANTLGGLAQNVIERLNNSEPIEISTGCLVEIEEIDNSDEYGAIWSRIESDHLAMLPEGATGACSISMGCGAPRLNQQRRVEMKNRTNEVKAKEIKVGPLKRLLSTFKTNERQTFFEDGPTYHDLLGELAEELRILEPALDWVPDANIAHTVVYYVTYSISGATYQGVMKWWRRTYTLDVTNFTVTINDDAVEVEPIQRYQAVEETTTSETRAAAENPTTTTTTVTANQSDDQTVAPPCSCNKGEKAMKKKDLVDKIMTAKKLKDSERAGLEALSEETLAAIAEEEKTEVEAKSTTSEPVAETPNLSSAPVTTNQVTANQVTISSEELSHLRSMAARFKAQEDEKRTALITQILANERGKIEFTKEELAKLDIVSLERNVRLLGLDSECGAVDYSTLGTAVRSNKKEVYKGGWSAALEEPEN